MCVGGGGGGEGWGLLGAVILSEKMRFHILCELSVMLMIEMKNVKPYFQKKIKYCVQHF